MGVRRKQLFVDADGRTFGSTRDQETDEVILIETESLERDELRRRIGFVKSVADLTPRTPVSDREAFNPLGLRTYDLIDIIAGRFAGKRGTLGFPNPQWPGWYWCCPPADKAVPITANEFEVVVAVDGIEPWPRAVVEAIVEEPPTDNAAGLPPDQRVVVLLSEAIAAGREMTPRQLTAQAHVSGKRAALARQIIGHDELVAEVIAGRLRLTEAASTARRRAEAAR